MILKPSNAERVSMMDSKGKIPYELLLNKKGRSRLPDKLMDHLNNEDLSEVIWWLPDGNSFAMDANNVQEKLLDVHFRGTKLTSFIRSLNRWGFRRIFFHAMPRNAMCFQSPHFKKGQPDLLREMKLATTASASARPAFSPDRSQASTATASMSQVDALFGDDLNVARAAAVTQPPGFLSPHSASLRGPASLGAAGLESPVQRALQANLQLQSSLDSTLSLSERATTSAAAANLSRLDSLGQAGLSSGLGSLGIPAAPSRLPFPGLPPLRTRTAPATVQLEDRGMRHHALLALMQRDELILQQLQPQPPSLSTGERPASPGSTIRTHDYIQGSIPSSSHATMLRGVTDSLLGGQPSLRQQQSLGTLADIRSLYATSSLSTRVGEAKQEDTQVPSAAETAVQAARAALAEHMARRGR